MVTSFSYDSQIIPLINFNPFQFPKLLLHLIRLLSRGKKDKIKSINDFQTSFINTVLESHHINSIIIGDKYSYLLGKLQNCDFI